jgi:DNA-binding MarR family transcriptional regulator
MTTAIQPVPEQDTFALAGRIGWAWKELRRGAAMGILRDHLFGQGEDALEPGQFDTLDLLVRQEAWRMSDLADALRVDPSTATRAVQRLLKEGLAERRSSMEDGRVVMVTASPAGRARHAAIGERRKDVLMTMVTEFDPEERAQLADLMERLVAALDHYAEDLQPGDEGEE